MEGETACSRRNNSFESVAIYFDIYFPRWLFFRLELPRLEELNRPLTARTGSAERSRADPCGLRRVSSSSLPLPFQTSRERAFLAAKRTEARGGKKNSELRNDLESLLQGPRHRSVPPYFRFHGLLTTNSHVGTVQGHERTFVKPNRCKFNRAPKARETPGRFPMGAALSSVGSRFELPDNKPRDFTTSTLGIAAKAR